MRPAANYRIYARWAAAADRATNAVYQVTHQSGTTNVTVDQRERNGEWVLLGTYPLLPGAGHNVKLTDNANGVVIADALKLVPDNANVVYAIDTDHLGTPRAVRSSTGTLVWRWDSDPFGVAAPNQDPDGDSMALTLPLRFRAVNWRRCKVCPI